MNTHEWLTIAAVTLAVITAPTAAIPAIVLPGQMTCASVPAPGPMSHPRPINASWYPPCSVLASLSTMPKYMLAE